MHLSVVLSKLYRQIEFRGVAFECVRGMDKDQEGELETELAPEGQANLATLNVADYLPNFKPAKSELLQRWFRGGALSVKGEEQEQMKDELLAFVQGEDRTDEVHLSKDESLQGNGPNEVDCEAKGEQWDRPGCKEEMDGERSSRAPPWTKVRRNVRACPFWQHQSWSSLAFFMGN